MLKNNARKYFKLIRLLGIGLFIFLLFQLDFVSIWKSIKATKFSLFLAGYLLQVLLLFVKSYRWHILKKGNNSREHLIDHFGEFLESYAIGVFTPGRVGEVMKAGYGKNKQEKLSSVFKVIAERGLDLGFFLLIAGLAMYFLEILPLNPVWAVVVILVAVFLMVLSIVFISENKLRDYIRRIFRKRSTKFSDYSEQSLNRNRVFVVIWLSVFGNVVTFLSCYFLALSISLEANILFISGGVAVAGLLNLLPITVMGLGTRELSFMYIFQSFDQSVVIAFSFIMFVVLQVGGGVTAMILGRIFLMKRRIK